VLRRRVKDGQQSADLLITGTVELWNETVDDLEWGTVEVETQDTSRVLVPLRRRQVDFRSPLRVSPSFCTQLS